MPATRLHRLVTLGTIALAVGLLGLAAHATLDPLGASAVYGVPVDAAGAPWVTASGLRDGVLGLAALVVLRHRAALPAFLACTLLLPLSDVALSLMHGSGPLAAAPHATGAVGIAVLLGLALVERRRAG
jgi:hypothetical protein